MLARECWYNFRRARSWFGGLLSRSLQAKAFASCNHAPVGMPSADDYGGGAEVPSAAGDTPGRRRRVEVREEEALAER